MGRPGRVTAIRGAGEPDRGFKATNADDVIMHCRVIFDIVLVLMFGFGTFARERNHATKTSNFGNRHRQ